MKNCVAIHDLSCYGKSSLTVVLPVLEALGVEVSPLPTAILSTQSDGYEDIFIEDLSNTMEQVLQVWQRLALRFDSVYSGYLGNEKQIDHILEFLASQRSRNQNLLVVVDPVLGDDGVPYQGITPKLVDRMSDLVAHASVITPNYTEAGLLLKKELPSVITEDDVCALTQELSLLGPERVVITSVPLSGLDSDHCSVACFDRGYTKVVEHHLVPGSFPGSGDLFASIVCAQLLNADSFISSVEIAAKFVELAVSRTAELRTERRQGIAPLTIIPDLVLHRTK